MKPTPPLFRKAILLLCSAAAWSALSGEANAQSASAPADQFCASPSTIACARKEMITDDQLRSAVATNSLANHLEKIFSEFSAPDPEAYASAKNRLTGILTYAEAHAAEMGIAVPHMYVSAVATQAAQTSEGTIFIPVNKDAFRLAVLADDGAKKLKLVLDREFAHIRNGDTSPSAVALHHNDPATSREAGLRADLEGAGPLGAKDPIAATAAIEAEMRTELHRIAFFKDTTVGDLDPGHLSDRDYKRISDEHQRTLSDRSSLAPWDRVIALRRESRLMAEYEQTHAVRNHSDREAESKWLVAQILPDAMRAGQ
jgi:hypothetical protein